MATVLPASRAGIGEQLGEGLSKGLNTGLQELAKFKMGQMQQKAAYQQRADAYKGFGFSPEESMALASLPEKSAAPIILQYLQRGGGGGVDQMQPEQQGLGGILQNLGEQQQMQAPQLQSRDILNLLAQPALGGLGLMSQQEQISPQGQEQLIKSLQPILQQQQLQSQQTPERRQELKAAHAAKKASLGEVLSRPSKAEMVKQQIAQDKETKPIFDEINKEYKTAKENDKRLDRIEVLTKKGSLGTPLGNAAIKTLAKGIFGFGIDLTNWMTADAQELDKLSTDFIRSAKDIFGGSRLTDADLNAFAKIIPSLSQSNNGRLRIVHNMRLFNEAAKIKKQALDKIIEANGGKRPANLESLIDKVAGPQLDELSARFKRGEAPEVRPPGFLGQIGQSLGLTY